MRRTTSALTTTILGAVLSASTVSAQQSPPSANARRAGSSAVSASAEAEADPTFGMAASRGPRYLLRNGLDYIDYQEYDRALKYLREAEKRQVELNKTEKLKLKQAVDRAQRGLRESIGSETPYALSQRSRRPGGVAAAPESRIVAAAPAIAPRDAAVSPATTSPGREGDDHAEPIRLTAADARAEAAADVRAGLPSVPAEPASIPEFPQAPDMPRLDRAPAPASATAPAPTAADAPVPPVVTRISPGDLKAAPAPAVEPADEPTVVEAIEAATAAIAAKADLTTPFPELDAAQTAPAPAQPTPLTAPTPVDESVKLSTAASEPITPEPAAAEPTPALLASPPAPAPAPEPITLETPDETAMHRPEPVAPAPAAEPALAPTEAPAALSARPIDTEPLALPPLGAGAAAAEPDPAPEPQPVPEAPRVAVAPADADLDLPALPSELQDRGRDAADVLPPPADELPLLPSGPSGAPADQPPAAAPPVGSRDIQPQAEPAVEPEIKAEATPDATAAPIETSIAEPVQEAPVAEPVQEAPVETPAPAPVVGDREPEPPSESFLPRRPTPVSTLSPELQSRVDEVARKMKDDYRISQAQPRPVPTPTPEASNDPTADLRSQTQIDISRAPSPAEARPIHAIPVPEDWVPVGARQWSAQRKYWAAAATCHLPLYFQDPMLERYGHSVENYVGPLGRFMAYPVDKHTQTTQRNQIAQPFASIGLFATQILALPYNLIMDPPWEAQYDLGYWRPGDKIPTDLYYLPTHGIGPPLKGRNY